MTIKLTTAFAASMLALAAPAFAQEVGDAAAGMKEYNKCKACHMIQAPDGEDIVKGGRTGPNLYGVLGREIASVEGFKYGDGILGVKEAHPGGTWDVEALTAYITDPTPWVDEHGTDPSAKSKMTFKMARNQADVVAFLLEHSPDAPANVAEADGDTGPAEPGGDAAAADAAPAEAAPAGAAAAPAAN
ncbi:cytochrome C [Paracoccus sp. S-4012]|uniref:c-type cytochrome n=1 Tax=Paracoccus sp. S-4012 TaxID=2665648 RepID=UPI0012B04D34|nr:cytochrome C [Paracoccus sp. S-4012]MRX49181.1 cytochrome C [Paracoccus sp. S-4012]